MFNKFKNKIKDIKFPLVTRKKLETALNNNAILNKNRVELSEKNVKLQKEYNELRKFANEEIEDLHKENKKLNVTIKGLTTGNEKLNEKISELEELNRDKTGDILHYKETCNSLEKRIKDYERIVKRAKKEVISKHCKKCGRFFRIASIDSYKKHCPTCEQKLKEERKNGRRK